MGCGGVPGDSAKPGGNVGEGVRGGAFEVERGDDRHCLRRDVEESKPGIVTGSGEGVRRVTDGTRMLETMTWLKRCIEYTTDSSIHTNAIIQLPCSICSKSMKPDES